MAVLDSSAIIHLLAGTNKGVVIEERFAQEAVATTAININEILIGLKAKEREEVARFLRGFEILPFDAEAAFKSIEIEEQLRTAGRMINKADILIAAICLVHQVPLITTDNDFQNIPGMTVRMP